MKKSVGRPPASGTPHPIAPYLSIEQIAWLNAQPNKSRAITNLIEQQMEREIAVRLIEAEVSATA